VTLPLLGFRRQTGRALGHPLVWLGRELTLRALTGQAGTLTRTTTAAPTDSHGVARTVVHSQPAWQTDTTHGRTGLLLGSTAHLAWPLPLIPQAMCGMVEFIELGTISTAGAGLFYIGHDGVTGARLVLDATGSQYRLTHHNGSASVAVTMSGTAPAAGQRVRLRWWLAGDGSVRLWQSLNDGAETGPSPSGALALAGAWGGGTCRLNSVGTANQGTTLALGTVVMLGNQTETTLRAALS
jgi:hypothetical protein